MRLRNEFVCRREEARLLPSGKGVVRSYGFGLQRPPLAARITGFAPSTPLLRLLLLMQLRAALPTVRAAAKVNTSVLCCSIIIISVHSPTHTRRSPTKVNIGPALSHFISHKTYKTNSNTRAASKTRQGQQGSTCT